MAANTISIMDKASGEITELPWGSSVSLEKGSVVKMPFGPEELSSASQMGESLVLVLVSGERIVIENFFVGATSDVDRMTWFLRIQRG